MSAHGYETKRDTLTGPQGRVLYHLERLFRSTGAGMREHGRYISEVTAAGLDARHVADWPTTDCIRALQIMERCVRAGKGFQFRHCGTQWEDFA